MRRCAAKRPHRATTLLVAAVTSSSAHLAHARGARVAAVSSAAGVDSRAMSSHHRVVAQGTSLVLEPKAGDASSTVFVLHGLGDTAHGWLDSVADALAPSLPTTRFILLTAPTRPVTVNMGMPMPAWYDIASLGKDRIDDAAEGLEESRARVAGLVEKEGRRGVPPSRVVLAGFSQGGALSLYTGANLDATLAGVLCMSGYLVSPATVAPTAASRATPVLMLHGEDDPLVLLSYGRESAAMLRELGVSSVAMKTYRGLPHSVSNDELEDALAFLKRVLA